MNDPADNAAEREETDRNLALEAMRSRYQETPEFDEEGNRRCVDCWALIPLMRIDSVNAVRCVGCQQEKESSEKKYA